MSKLDDRIRDAITELANRDDIDGYSFSTDHYDGCYVVSIKLLCKSELEALSDEVRRMRGLGAATAKHGRFWERDQ
jgi:hypothetical protein